MSKDQTVQQIFQSVFRENRWRNKQSISGPGSTLGATRVLRQALPALFAKLQIKTLVDAPCGDANWMRHLDYPLDKYIGVDIVPELIARLREELPAPRWQFEVGDITANILPGADAVLCRDCLVHLSFDLGLTAVGNFAAAGFKYVLTTTYPGTENRDIPTGRWRALDLEAAPFNFPPPLTMLTEKAVPAEERPAKCVGVWRAQDIAAAAASYRTSRSGIAKQPLTLTETVPGPPPPPPPPSRARGKIAKAEVKERLAEIGRLRSQKQKKQAAVLAEKLYAQAPDKHSVASTFCRSLFETRDFQRALEQAISNLDNFRHAHCLSALCEIYFKLGRYQEAAQTTARFLDDPEMASRALVMHGGALLRATGDLDPSVEFFHRAVQAGVRGSDYHPARQILRNREFEALTLQDDPARNPIRFLDSHAGKAKAVVAASADEKYFRALFEIYRETFFSHNADPGHVLHFHIFDPSPALLDEISTLSRMSQGRIRFSHEQTGGGNRSYFYAGRFVQMPRLLAHYDCPIVMTDMDCYFAGGVEPLLEVTAKADLGIVEVNRRLSPWVNFLANLVVFNPTVAGRRFALGMRNFLLNMPSDVNYWYVDQLALVQCAYLNRNLGFGEVPTVNAAWSDFCRQASGTTGRPEAKASRMRERLTKESR